jgi:hypothetical protein
MKTRSKSTAANPKNHEGGGKMKEIHDENPIYFCMKCGELVCTDGPCLEEVQTPKRGEVVLGPHHYYGVGRIIWLHADDARALRQEKKSKWQEFRGVAFGEAQFTRPHPVLDQVHQLLEREYPRKVGEPAAWLILLEGADGHTVHVGSFHVKADAYILAG